MRLWKNPNWADVSPAYPHAGQIVARTSQLQNPRLHLSTPVPVSPQTAGTRIGATRQAREKEPGEYEALGDT
jgi:hypothetical protein